jgi:hypothetical protein
VPLAIMGVRGRVGHRSGQRAQGTRARAVLTTAFPITLASVSCRKLSLRSSPTVVRQNVRLQFPLKR